MIVVDTNVLVYAANVDSAEHDRCNRLLASLRAGRTPWFTTWPILYEFLRVVTHARVLPRPWTASAALSFVDAILQSPSHSILVESEHHLEFAQDLAPRVTALAGNLLHDFHTAVLMKEHGISRVCTRDADFRRFAFVEVIDPLADPQ